MPYLVLGAGQPQLQVLDLAKHQHRTPVSLRQLKKPAARHTEARQGGHQPPTLDQAESAHQWLGHQRCRRATKQRR